MLVLHHKINGSTLLQNRHLLVNKQDERSTLHSLLEPVFKFLYTAAELTSEKATLSTLLHNNTACHGLKFKC